MVNAPALAFLYHRTIRRCSLGFLQRRIEYVVLGSDARFHGSGETSSLIAVCTGAMFLS